MATQRNPPRDPAMQGEGNRSADRNYREGAQRHANDPASKRAAQDAERAVESEDEREELEEAEQAGKARRKDSDN